MNDSKLIVIKSWRVAESLFGFLGCPILPGIGRVGLLTFSSSLVSALDRWQSFPILSSRHEWLSKVWHRPSFEIVVRSYASKLTYRAGPVEFHYSHFTRISRSRVPMFPACPCILPELNSGRALSEQNVARQFL